MAGLSMDGSFLPWTAGMYGSLVRRVSFLGLALLCVALSACASTPRSDAVPIGRHGATIVAGIPNARFYTDQVEAIQAEQARALVREARHKGVRPGGTLPKTYGLVLSGGGDNGAFGAGLLVGWSRHGGRPDFKFVSGVSTGALIAPFAFLGPAYDAMLQEIFTKRGKSGVYRTRFAPLAALFQDAILDSQPLSEGIAQAIDDKLVAEIAREYDKGRLLVVQTTDLDSGRAVLWNLGAIAASDSPQKIALIRKILLASAAIPAVFPPVLFDVEVDGQRRQELHVDGGAVSQTVVGPMKLDINSALGDAGYRHAGYDLYVIRNGRIRPDWEETSNRTLTVARRAVAVLTTHSGVSDLYKLHLVTKRGKAGFRLAYIPDAFDSPHDEEFSLPYMNDLFRFGYERAAKGYPWENAPPGLNSVE